MSPALPLCLLACALPLTSWSQSTAFAQGARVVARPSAQWEECTVAQAMPESGAYRVKCRTGEYVVPTGAVQAPTPQALAQAQPPSAAPGMPKVGDAVLASPMGLDNDWRPCVVTQDLTHRNAYAVRCGNADWTVVMKWVKKAAAAPVSSSPAPAAAPAGPAAPAPASPGTPAPPQPPVTPPPVPQGPRTDPRPGPAPPPVAATPPAAGRNGAIPDGIYVAPVGGSIETIQVVGGRMAYRPRIPLTAATMTTANAAMVGTMQVAGDSLTVTWTDGKVRDGRFKMDGPCLVWGYLYCRAKPFARGVRLEGRYTGSATAGAGVVSRTSEISFQPDGTYRASATGAIGAPAGTTGAAASASAETGRYQLDGWTLRLTSASGRTREVLAFPYDVYGPADPIYVDGGFMRKQR